MSDYSDYQHILVEKRDGIAVFDLEPARGAERRQLPDAQ